jgi:alkylated DNA repair dioxygenase AlkB
LVNASAHPIDELESAAGRALLTHCHSMLEQQGFVALPGFLTPSAVASMLEETRALEAQSVGFYSTEDHNIFLSEEGDASTRSLPQDHPRRMMQSSSKLLFAADQLPSDSALREVYRWPPLLRFVRAALCQPSLHLSVDPMGAYYLNVFDRGDQLGWHFDNSEFSVSLVLQPGVAGGAFEYAHNSRGRVEAMESFAPAELDVLAPPLESGSLYLFKGRHSLHRVAPVTDGKRINAILTFNSDPTVVLNEYTRRKFFGRGAEEIARA